MLALALAVHVDMIIILCMFDVGDFRTTGIVGHGMAQLHGAEWNARSLPRARRSRVRRGNSDFCVCHVCRLSSGCVLAWLCVVCRGLNLARSSSILWLGPRSCMHARTPAAGTRVLHRNASLAHDSRDVRLASGRTLELTIRQHGAHEHFNRDAAHTALMPHPIFQSTGSASSSSSL